MKNVAIIWKQGSSSAGLEVTNGTLGSLAIAEGNGTVSGGEAQFDPGEECRLHLALESVQDGPGSGATLVTVRNPVTPFSFFTRDVGGRHPIFLPNVGAVVTDVDDSRKYDEIARDISRTGVPTATQRMESEPEESFENAAANTRPTTCPTWLGLGRDIRIFEFDFPKAYRGVIRPRLHNTKVPMPDWENNPVEYSFALGRGITCIHNNTRGLENRVLPILRGCVPDEEIQYELTAFVALEKSPLTASAVAGTHYLVSYANGIGATLTDAHKKQLEELNERELNRDEEPVLFIKAEAVNSGSAPRYAWIQSPIPVHVVDGWSGPKWAFDRDTGFCMLENGNVFCVMRVNGKPVPQPEMGVLLEPGETATFEMLLPHRPITKARALKLAKRPFESCIAECREFWSEKLSAGAQVQLPEPRIDEMVRAGILHLDMVAYGSEPDGPVNACTGMYTAIGTESAPIIQFLDSMGRHDLARRALMFFLEIQREDGSMIAFGDYLVETGAVLWSLGEHYRYTRDDDWVRQIAPKVLKACDHLIAWRERSIDESLRGRGYGMIDGQVCDYPDPFRHFFLNGYACMGIQRVSEMLSSVDPGRSKELATVAEAWKSDIRESFFESMARSPVVPLRNGTWCPTAPPWAEGTGPVSTFADNIDWYSEERYNYYNRTGAQFWVRDSMLGPHYLVFQEILDPSEPAAEYMQDYNTDIFMKRNVASAQPYYSRHTWIHLVRGEVNSFLKAYYNCMATQADRETYTFPEGIQRSVLAIEKESPHKTHEEGWFLLETRWMLYMERGKTLRFLPGVPRAWLAHGQSIKLEQVATYFGKASLTVESSSNDGVIRAVVECTSDRQPERMEVRLPHPDGRTALNVEGGTYDPKRECVCIEPFKDRAEIVVQF